MPKLILVILILSLTQACGPDHYVAQPSYVAHDDETQFYPYVDPYLLTGKGTIYNLTQNES